MPLTHSASRCQQRRCRCSGCRQPGRPGAGGTPGRPLTCTSFRRLVAARQARSRCSVCAVPVLHRSRAVRPGASCGCQKAGAAAACCGASSQTHSERVLRLGRLRASRSAPQTRKKAPLSRLFSCLLGPGWPSAPTSASATCGRSERAAVQLGNQAAPEEDLPAGWQRHCTGRRPSCWLCGLLPSGPPRTSLLCAGDSSRCLTSRPRKDSRGCAARRALSSASKCCAGVASGSCAAGGRARGWALLACCAVLPAAAVAAGGQRAGPPHLPVAADPQPLGVGVHREGAALEQPAARVVQREDGRRGRVPQGAARQAEAEAVAHSDAVEKIQQQVRRQPQQPAVRGPRGGHLCACVGGPLSARAWGGAQGPSSVRRSARSYEAETRRRSRPRRALPTKQTTGAARSFMQACMRWAGFNCAACVMAAGLPLATACPGGPHTCPLIPSRPPSRPPPPPAPRPLALPVTLSACCAR
jgi:hypothetical protein